MKKKILTALLPITLITSCVTAPVQLADKDSVISEEQQLAAQNALEAEVTKLALKRKIAVGRLSNETTYGKSLLSDSPTDKIAEKVSDMFVQGLTNSGNYLIFERPDVDLLKSEASLTGTEFNMVGVDTLIVGSLTEFGRGTTGKSGFVTSTKKQEATATIDLRLVEVSTGLVIHSITGQGSASIESQNTMGFGSVAGYDGSINDQAIGAAVNAAVSKLNKYMADKTWTADVLDYDDGLIYISGGQSQGLKPGINLGIFTKGKQVKAKATGTMITLPGKQIASIEILSSFGDTELEEGSVASLVSGSIEGKDITTIEVKELK